MTSARNDKKDIRAVARVLGITYLAALRLVETREQSADFPMGERLDYRNMTDDRIREIFQ